MAEPNYINLHTPIGLIEFFNFRGKASQYRIFGYCVTYFFYKYNLLKRTVLKLIFQWKIFVRKIDLGSYYQAL